jgi:hypothetical protein
MWAKSWHPAQNIKLVQKTETRGLAELLIDLIMVRSYL